MLLSVEGIAVPDVRNATADDEAAFNKLVDKAYNLWLKNPDVLRIRLSDCDCSLLSTAE
jgi:hypothetical protein